uniref:Uncharacterized protein n=1 Tax=Cuerna arida TaxID=1464854 RepID=A0A1B6GYQ6_9HEMI
MVFEQPSTSATSTEVLLSRLGENCKEMDPNFTSKNKIQEIPGFWKNREVATRKYTNVSLYPAGNILHIVHKKKSKEEKRKADEKTYEMRWLSPDSFDELRVMPRMLLDHLPENVYKVITTVLDEQETEIEDNVEFIM